MRIEQEKRGELRDKFKEPSEWGRKEGKGVSNREKGNGEERYQKTRKEKEKYRRQRKMGIYRRSS